MSFEIFPPALMTRSLAASRSDENKITSGARGRCSLQLMTGMRDLGLRLVYSFDSSRLDLPQLLSALWNPQVLANPATKIGPSAVRYAKDIPAGSSMVRFVLEPGDYQPDVLLYFAPDRILNIFKLATEHCNFTRHITRGIVKSFR